jgi:hypothetical protein
VLGVLVVVLGLLWSISGWGSVARSCGDDGARPDSCAAQAHGLHQAFALVVLGAALLVASWILRARLERDERLARSTSAA